MSKRDDIADEILELRRERDEALAQVAVLLQAAEGARHPDGMANEGDIQFWYERLAHALAEGPADARALLDRLQRAEAVAKRYEVKVAKDGLWIHLHGDTKEGAINLSECGGPITRAAVLEVYQALAAWEENK